MVLMWVVGFTLLLWSGLATASTYYLSPDGSDQASGQADAPWRRWPHAVRQLKPGDILILRPGTYTPAAHGDFTVACGSQAKQGTPSEPITIRAEPERQALLALHGRGDSLRIRGCRSWRFEGLQVRGSNVAGGGDIPGMIDVHDSLGLTFRRLLVSRSNSHDNNSLLLLLNTSQSLVEESEFYDFHRYAMISKFGSGNTFRRTYANSRNAADGPGYDSYITARGDAAIATYPGSNHVMENNISEGNGTSVFLEAFGPTQQNRILGQVSLRDLYGVLLRARGDSASTMPQQTMIENLVVVQPQHIGVYARSAKQTRCVNCSVFGGQQGLVADTMESYPGDGTASFFAENPLVVQVENTGVNMVAQASWQIDSPNMFANGTNFSPNKGEPQITNIRTMDPGLGSCYVVIPESSPMKGKGQGGKDIGANVVYRYQNGVLTGMPLWSSAGFPCGAVVPGVNDVAGASCRDVHERLHVNIHGCVVPTGQGPPPPSAGPLPAPTAFRVVMP